MKMQSSMVTVRTISRILKSKFSTLPAAFQRVANPNPHFISVVCGFPKDLRTKYKIGKFGDDAYFTSSSSKADVIGERNNLNYVWRMYNGISMLNQLRNTFSQIGPMSIKFKV